MSNKLEILAPAGNREMLGAAALMLFIWALRDSTLAAPRATLPRTS